VSAQGHPVNITIAVTFKGIWIPGSLTKGTGGRDVKESRGLS
jgi:hypothetical protein